ncbi:ATP-dependent DNA helicase RecQ [Paenibacillus endophyticus]|uniref:DNA 3'-5' helicase n=1 Tax=Paenibacillus endophyticus TaxID=1294268 RepID=A0A7W5GD19_9BACL|nr:DEAD/DEAH box helicase [Paenibacillus endophyticus]MBB3155455.1 ATP-dependent DNA helicase RecQ [Paenibacillus endophyticus]
MALLEKFRQLAVKQLGDKPRLLVLKGFHSEIFQQINDNKLTDAPINISIQDLDRRKALLIPQLFNKDIATDFYWCTFEEYLLFGEELLQLYYSVNIIRNNLYHHTYPAIYDINVDDQTWEVLSDEETDYDDNGDEQLGLIYRYFGSVRRIGAQVFVTYPNVGEHEVTFYEEVKSLPSKVLMDGEYIHLELSENEDTFLELEDDLLNSRIPSGDVFIAVTGDLNATPHQYHERLLTLQAVVQTNYMIYLVAKETKPRAFIDNTPYISVLKRYWGYSGFRTLKMYTNVQSRIGDKTTTEISQVQIVDDIIQQALKAKAGEDYRDLFVTSPTGAGKSVMFQVPAIYLAETYNMMTIIISPLIGLMNDQVQGLLANQVHMSATINSEISPVEKIEIRNRIQSGQVSILYISPETLLSRSDIAQLIGEREVGLFVIDEAHIVTTWGKAFRSDYWYLGTYLSKLRKERNFPIATFTATAIYGGIEDMYVETRDSLNLISPISYFGYVRRDDLEIQIKRKLDYDKRFSEYLMDKNKLLLNRVERFVQQRSKTLVYFPTVRSILDFKEFVRVYGTEEAKSNLSIYYGPLEKEVKNENYLRFKSNEALVMLATKAFGMGIDIPDIQNVYHFAPTGNVCDYIQEIGRAARALDTGYAYFDFLPQDFVHVQRLHGISTIKKGQLVQVMQKILSILDGHKGKNIRNLLISADEFRYIFQEGNTRENDGFDNKIKTALLIIEKDFQAKLTYSPIIARPRSIFANEYFNVPYEAEGKIFPKYGQYFALKHTFGEGSKRKSIYQVDLKGIWQDHFQSMSFPEFKYQFHSGDRVKLPFRDIITPVLQVQLHLKTNNVSVFQAQVKSWAERINTIMSRYAKTKAYFNIEELASELLDFLGGTKYASQMMAEVILDSCYTYDRLMRQSNNFYNRFLAYDESRAKYHFISSGYAGFTDWMIQETHHMLHQQMSLQSSDQEQDIYFPKLFGSEQEKRFIYLGLMESLGLLMYRINGGDNPEIFIRINSRMQLERTVGSPARYRNYILENVHQRHKLSVEMMRYIFENQVDTKRFWDLIEDYFLGEVPEEIIQRLS